MGAELIPMVFTSGWASGINAYIAVLVLGLADRFYHLAEIPDALARTDVLIGAGVLFLIEMVADKIPYVDSVWDSVHTVVRPAVGATLGYLFANQGSSIETAIAVGTGGVVAFISHLVKAGLRTAVNTSPEPASNIVVSTSEDVTVTGVMALAVAHPWWAATIAFVLLAVGVFLVYKLAGRIRRVKRRYDAWGERIGIGSPSGRPEADMEPPPASQPRDRLVDPGSPGP